MRNQSVGHSVHSGIERPASGTERLVRLQHHGEFGHVEAADMDQRARALFGGHLLRMHECVAHLAQADKPVRRRQVQRR